MYVIGIQASTSAVTCSHGKPGHQFGWRSKPRDGYVIAAIGMSPASSRRILLSARRRVVLSAGALEPQRLDVERDAVERGPAGVRNASIARARRASSAGLTNPGRYHATTRIPRALSASTKSPSAFGLTTSTVLRSFAVST